VLDAATGAARADGLEVVTHPRLGDPAEALIAVAEEHDADLLVSRNRGISRTSRFLWAAWPTGCPITHPATCLCALNDM
jgi:nucleotide-binding universal stress UspA family protein